MSIIKMQSEPVYIVGFLLVYWLLCQASEPSIIQALADFIGRW